jgi:hypothetical protein
MTPSLTMNQFGSSKSVTRTQRSEIVVVGDSLVVDDGGAVVAGAAVVDGRVAGDVVVGGAPADSTSRSNDVAVLPLQAAAIVATEAIVRRRRTASV